MFWVESEADMRFFAAPKADPTFSDMFMNDVDEEIDVLKNERFFFLKSEKIQTWIKCKIESRNESILMSRHFNRYEKVAGQISIHLVHLLLEIRTQITSNFYLLSYYSR